jgi:outer membrane receptor protein involved in Fe transport
MPLPQALPPADPPAAIVITARALPDPSAERAFDVRTLDRKQLAQNPSHQLDEVLGQVAGLQLFRRSDSTSGHPTSQGVTLRALGGTASSRALLILDGVPQTDPFGGWVNWPAYNPAGLAEVRVIRGGGSVSEGPGALAGVIEMRSLAEETIDGSLEGGSRQSLNGQVYAGQGVGAGLFTVSAQAGRSDGFIPITASTRGPVDERSPYEEANMRGRWVVPVASDVELQASALGFIDVRSRGTPFSRNRTRGADASLRAVGTGRWQWEATGYAQWRNLRSSFASVNDDRTSAQRVSLQDSVPGRALGGSVELRPPVAKAIELRIGADARFSTGKSRELFAFAASAPTRRRIAGGQSQTQGLFAEASWTGGPVTLSGGARIDHWRITDGQLVERLLATGEPTRDDQYRSRGGWLPTTRTGAVLDLGQGMKLRSAAYLGWRMPTLNELFRPFRAGADATAANVLLDPERLRGIEGGLQYSSPGIDLSATVFANRLSHAIANVTLGHGPGNFPGVGFVAGVFRQRQNIDAVEVRGVELSGSARRGPWAVRLDASYSDPRVEADGPAAALDGLRPAQTPKLAISGSIGWERNRRALSVVVQHVSAQYDDDLNLRRLRPATTIGAFAAWPVNRRVQLIARAENLFDATVMAGVADDGTVERATPQTFWIGVRFE